MRTKLHPVLVTADTLKEIHILKATKAFKTMEEVVVFLLKNAKL